MKDHLGAPGVYRAETKGKQQFETYFGAARKPISDHPLDHPGANQGPTKNHPGTNQEPTRNQPRPNQEPATP